MTAEQISAFAAVLLSLAFSYIPNANTWYAALGPVNKRLLMLALLAVVAGGALVYNCQAATACLQANYQTYLNSLWDAAVANQVTFLLSPAPAAVLALKARLAGRV